MEERQRDRISKKLLIKVDGHTCIMLDMSKTGMRLIVPFLLKKQAVDIIFQMENVLLELKGIIRWIKKELIVYDQVQYQVGVSLIAPPEEYTILIEKLLSNQPVD